MKKKQWGKNGPCENKNGEIFYIEHAECIK